MPTSIVAVGVLAGALALHAELLARLRRVDAPTPPWWFGYARDGTNLSAALIAWGAYLGFDYRAGGRLSRGRADDAVHLHPRLGVRARPALAPRARWRWRSRWRRGWRWSRSVPAPSSARSSGSSPPCSRSVVKPPDGGGRGPAGLSRPGRRSAPPASRRAARSVRAPSPAPCRQGRRCGPRRGRGGRACARTSPRRAPARRP